MQLASTSFELSLALGGLDNFSYGFYPREANDGNA